AITSKKLGLRISHVEAGLRSFDWSMPEEINRVVTDRLSDLLFVAGPSGTQDPLREGVDESRIVFVGNVMIDTLRNHMSLIDQRTVIQDYQVSPQSYIVATLHRPSNTDDADRLLAWMRAFEDVAAMLPVIFPVHPRTKKFLESMRYSAQTKLLNLVEPLGYLDMISL